MFISFAKLWFITTFFHFDLMSRALIFTLHALIDSTLPLFAIKSVIQTRTVISVPLCYIVSKTIRYASLFRFLPPFLKKKKLIFVLFVYACLRIGCAN